MGCALLKPTHQPNKHSWPALPACPASSTPTCSNDRKPGRLLFATVRGAGHMVPYVQPQRALHLAAHFLAGRDL